MEIINILNVHNFEPSNYILRPTVKVVITNDENKILTFGNFLPGGGADENESLEDAAKRECVEELGATIDIQEGLGLVVQYRDFLKKKYEVYGFLAKVKNITKPTTTQEDELQTSSEWKTFDDAIVYIENIIHQLESGDFSDYTEEHLQAKLYNSKTHLMFIQKAKEILSI